MCRCILLHSVWRQKDVVRGVSISKVTSDVLAAVWKNNDIFVAGIS
jgi:hypothetical protein